MAKIMNGIIKKAALILTAMSVFISASSASAAGSRLQRREESLSRSLARIQPYANPRNDAGFSLFEGAAAEAMDDVIDDYIALTKTNGYDSASFSAAQDVANAIEAVVNNSSVINTTLSDGRVNIDGAAVAEKNAAAAEIMNRYTDTIAAAGSQLNRELVNEVTVHVTDADLSDFTYIVITNENLEKIRGISSLKISFKNTSEYIVINKEAFGYILNSYKELHLQLRQLSGTYSLRFLDAGNNIISKYGTDIGLAIPAEHSEQTVYLFTDNRQENWGGQYNAVNHSIEIMTKFTGEYNVASPEIVINDIDGLSDYEQQAIRFMVARGYFDLSGGSFNPNATLTRYSFAQSLVRMFFALDNDAVCTFTDVDEANYKYVAASQQSSIVEGYSDNTFRGNQDVTVEQVIALTARTINQKNGYVYPEQVNKYLNFTDDNKISDWAEKEVALALREGIYSNEMQLKFSGSISRKDAAVILYRLFMIMNNTPEQSASAAADLDSVGEHDTFWTERNAVIVVIATAAIDIAALAAAFILVRKKRMRSKS